MKYEKNNGKKNEKIINPIFPFVSLINNKDI